MEKSYNYDGAASLGLKGQDSSESSEEENGQFDDGLLLEQQDIDIEIVSK
jgi:hypothetical protein